MFSKMRTLIFFFLCLTNSKCKFNKCNLFYFARIYESQGVWVDGKRVYECVSIKSRGAPCETLVPFTVSGNNTVFTARAEARGKPTC